MAVIRPGLPLLIVEGEFDALRLGQELEELAGVATLGSASARPERAALLAMLAAHVWCIALDADDAGDKAALEWPDRARRVRLPAPHQDWSDFASACGTTEVRRWWKSISEVSCDPRS